MGKFFKQKYFIYKFGGRTLEEVKQNVQQLKLQYGDGFVFDEKYPPTLGRSDVYKLVDKELTPEKVSEVIVDDTYGVGRFMQYEIELAKQHNIPITYVSSQNMKLSSYAPGIPDRSIMTAIPTITAPQKWEYVLQRHTAKRAGVHYDFRIGPVGGAGFSWVLKNGLPSNGEKTLAIRQPDHTLKYFEFEGTIQSGYGAGDVEIVERGQVEVIKSNPDKLTFYLYDSKPVASKFTLIKTGDKEWLMLNHSITKNLTDIFEKYPRQKFKDMTGMYVPEQGDIETPKIDGAYSLTILRPNKHPVVFARRVSKKTGGPIEYTGKIPGMLGTVSPKSLGNTVLRTEVYGMQPDGTQLPNRLLGGMLNAKVDLSREMQKTLGTPLRLAIWDVVKYKGKDVSKLPFEQKIPLIKDVSQEFKILDPITDIGKKMQTPEGSVIWRGSTPLKVKNRLEFDMYVRDIFPAELTKGGVPRAGGIVVSSTPRGKITTNVGTGFTHVEAQDILQHPKKYIGRVAKIYAMDKLPSGKLRAPAFNTWHLEK